MQHLRAFPLRSYSIETCTLIRDLCVTETTRGMKKMSHPVDIHVGKRLKQIRTLRRMSQTDVAKRLSLSFQQIQKYEIGSNRIAASRLFELSRILDVPTSYWIDHFGWSC